jgi:hypothetical protein
MDATQDRGPDTTRDRPARRTALFWLVAAALVTAIGLLVAGMLVGAGGGDHAKFHAILGLLALMPAGILAAQRGRPTLASLAPTIGLWLLAATQLIEGVGALGYGADGYTRVNGLVALHDLGLGLAPIGLIGAAVGVAAGIGSLVGRRSGHPRVAATVTVLAGLIALAGVAKMIGL